MTQQRAIKKIISRLRVQTVAFKDAGDDVILPVQKKLSNLLDNVDFFFTKSDPSAILFASGGSEKVALNKLADRRHILLLAFAENNAYAAATEVKAYLGDKGVKSYLFNLSEPESIPELIKLLHLWARVRAFTHKKIGLLGRSSDWLVHSIPDPNELRARFGIRLSIFDWDDQPNPADASLSIDFLDFYKGHGKKDFEDNSRIDSIIARIWDENKLDGIAVECFPLVKKYSVTACLTLARLNNTGMPAACEGDLVSLTGMLFIRQVTGIIPWMANLSGVFKSFVEFSHCTIAPDQVENYSFETHFETDKGLAVAGVFKEDETYTIFRWDKRFENCFIAVGRSTEHNKQTFACRTQLRLILSKKDTNTLQYHPLGNHHLIVKGDWYEPLALATDYLNITLI